VPVDGFAFLRDMGIATPRQQMDYWRRYLDKYRHGGPPDVLLERTWDWLSANFPADEPEGFAWGDARVPNMIYRGTACVGLLDWDMVSLAGAECDIAWWLVNDIAGSAQVGRLEGLHGPRSTVEVWEDESGRKARNMEFWLMFNLFRLGAIMIRLKGFLTALGTPPDAIRDMDRINTAQSILHDRWGAGSTMGLGLWSDLSPAIDA
jgi:aminoglycoside phosphotransferase (APT) family kinase protein